MFSFYWKTKTVNVVVETTGRKIVGKSIGFVDVADEVVHSLTKHMNYSALLPRFSVSSLSIQLIQMRRECY